MRILGLSAFRHDAAAAVLEDGVITTAIENDKLVRTGSHRPEAAIQSCFESLTMGWDGIDLVALGSKHLRRRNRKTPAAKALSVASSVTDEFGVHEVGFPASEPNDASFLGQLMSVDSGKVIDFDHHLCHAASAFYLSSFERALILTMDEEGEGTSAMLAIGEGSVIRALRRIAFPHSLALVYSLITELIGFRPHLEEHKTQWLSLEGQPDFKNVFRQMLCGRVGALPHLDLTFFRRGLGKKLSLAEKFFESVGLPSDPKKINHEERRTLASSLQAACAELVVELTQEVCRREGLKEVCLGGGLFQNVLLVAAVENSLGRERVFVPPAPGNSGTSLGAACLAWHDVLKQPRMQAMTHAYLGPKFGRQEIKDVLDNCKNRYSLSSTEERKLDAALQLLHAGKIVGWFQGAAEFGPRALGNRSVLASPWAPFVRENLNDFIKHREWFRPFAISVPEEDCPRYFEASGQCRWMNSLANSTAGSECLPEAFHLPTGQVRLHMVERRTNPLFWALLKRFGEEAPAPMLLNTSFNLFGEPLVVTPRDAMRSYFGSGLDALIIDRFVLSKSPMQSSIPAAVSHRLEVPA
jgi:carbamoyltransferase